METVIRLNFHFAVWMSILGGIVLFNRPDLIVPDLDELFGPLRNNLLFVSLILSLNQLILWFARYTRGSTPEILLMGFLFLLVGGGLQYYGRINGIPMNPWCSIAAFYVGLSHLMQYWALTRKLDELRL